jgi:hypothetical protein
MTDQQMPRGIRQDISVQKIGRETLVYDRRSHKAFCLNECSSIVWDLANGERTLDELTHLVSAALNASIDQELVMLAMQQLREQQLMELAPSGCPQEPISRRDVLRKLGAGCAALLPVIASIAAPTAAQAYSGCVDCSVAPGRPQRIRRAPISPLDPSQ